MVAIDWSASSARPAPSATAWLDSVISDGRLLVFGLDELKLQGNGSPGLTLMDVDAATPLVSVATVGDALRVEGAGRGDKAKVETLGSSALANHVGKGACMGRKIEGFKRATRVLA